MQRTESFWRWRSLVFPKLCSFLGEKRPPGLPAGGRGIWISSPRARRCRCLIHAPTKPPTPLQLNRSARSPRAGHHGCPAHRSRHRVGFLYLFNTPLSDALLERKSPSAFDGEITGFPRNYNSIGLKGVGDAARGRPVHLA